MTDAKFDLDGFLPYQFAVLASRMSREFSKLYRQKFDISIPEWRVVAHLAQSGTVSVREIHARVDMDKSKVSRAATRLTDNGYITKKPDPDDGRLVALSLTPKGQDMIAQIVPMARAYESEVLKSLSEPNSLHAALAELLTPENRD